MGPPSLPTCGPAYGHLPLLQAHSSLRSCKHWPSGHPRIAQGKQRNQLRRVLSEPFVAHLGKAKLALDNSKRVFHLGPHTGLDLLGYGVVLGVGHRLSAIHIVRIGQIHAPRSGGHAAHGCRPPLGVVLGGGLAHGQIGHRLGLGWYGWQGGGPKTLFADGKFASC